MYTIFSIDVCAFYVYCCDVYIDVCFALAIPGSAKSTLDLLVLAVITAAISQWSKTVVSLAKLATKLLSLSFRRS